MSTLYIRLPSKSAADSAANWLELACPFALVSHSGSIEREGVASLSDLSGTVAKTQRVVALLAASDVTLLRVQIPPLSAARLRAALPNLVEEQLIADPSACAMVAGGLSDGLRTVAVMQRDWLDRLVKALIAFGAGRITALPAQLCLPCQPGNVTAAIGEQGDDIDVLLRFSEQDGIGLVLAHEQQETSAQVVVRALCAVVPEAPITLYVPQSAVRNYQESIDQDIVLAKRINVLADSWPRWIAAAREKAVPDLMLCMGAGGSSGLDWRAWRWPLALLFAVLSIHATFLNIDWWRMKSEANSLRAAMIQTYRSAYPKETVILDPVAQMRQKIALAKRNSGLPTPDDFTAITAAFGEAWASVMPGKTTLAIASVEYRERGLLVRLKPALGRAEKFDIEAPMKQMQAALAGRNLSLDLAPAQPEGAVTWQIRSTK